MDFEKICMMFQMQEPFYGIILSSMTRAPSSLVDTLGVTISGNTFMLYYNPNYLADKTPEATLELLKHEVLHVAFNHFANEKFMNVPQSDHQILNIAEDMEVNCYINRNNVKDLDLIYPDSMGWGPNLGTKAYYQMLKAKRDEQQQEQQAKDPQQPCNGGQGEDDDQQQQQNQTQQNQNSGGSTPQQDSQQDDGQSSDQIEIKAQPVSTNSSAQPGQTVGKPSFEDQFNQFDDHSKWPTEQDASEDTITEMIDTMLEFAAEEVEKSCGNIPGEIAGRIKDIRKKPKPVTDWKRYFRRFLGNEFSALMKKSKKRESKRFPDAAGNRHKRKSHILVAIDTSGSVSMPEYIEFFGQLKTMTDSSTFHVVECDARIQYEYDFKNKPNLVLHGGGGTSFQPVVDMYVKERKKYDCLVYFTDGECSIPRNTPKDTLWVISSKGDHNRAKYKVNGASVVIIPKKDK